jgi:hypothetical protein
MGAAERRKSWRVNHLTDWMSIIVNFFIVWKVTFDGTREWKMEIEHSDLQKTCISSGMGLSGTDCARKEGAIEWMDTKEYIVRHFLADGKKLPYLFVRLDPPNSPYRSAFSLKTVR